MGCQRGTALSLDTTSVDAFASEFAACVIYGTHTLFPHYFSHTTSNK